MTWRTDLYDRLDLAPHPIEMKPHTTALLLIDIQNGATSPNCGFGPSLTRHYPAAAEYYYTTIRRDLIPNAEKLLTLFRNVNARIIHLTLGPQLPDGSDMTTSGSSTGLGSDQPVGSPDHQIIAELQPRPGELVINKTSRGAFNSTSLERALHNLKVSSVVGAGITTSACVETTLRDAADRGFSTTLIHDACAEFDESAHHATLRQFAMRSGKVLSTSELTAQLGDVAQRQPR